MALAQDIANQVGANKVYKGPTFEQLLPYEKAWGAIKPIIEQEGASQINPFIQRNLNKSLYDYYTQLSGRGGQRFGFGGAGSLEAEADKQRKAQMLDWINQREQGYKSLFYDPAQQAFMKGIEMGQTPTAPKIPTWEEMAAKYGSSYKPTNQPIQGLQRQFGPELMPIQQTPSMGRLPMNRNQLKVNLGIPGYEMPTNLNYFRR